MLVPITVHVPEHLVPHFYERFGEFVSDKPAADLLTAPKRLESGAYAPAWVDSDEADDLARSLWKELSPKGEEVLLYLAQQVESEPRHFTPADIAGAMEHPNGVSGIAGILGGVGKAIRRAGLPVYTTPSGGTWHYVWDWDGAEYTMTPDVARLIREANYRRD